METQGFIIEGTSCENCEKQVLAQAQKVKGVKEVTFDLATETGYVTFDEKKTDIDEILSKIEEKGYTGFILDSSPGDGAGERRRKVQGWVFGIIGVLVAGYFLFNIADSVTFPKISQGMGYGLLFLVGLLTGFHCISMCGGFVINYTAEDAQKGRKSHRSHIMYGAGKLVSYTLIGACFGLLGSIIAFTPMLRGIAGILAGIFLMLFGLRMLNIFPVLRRFMIRTPRFLSRLAGSGMQKNSTPLATGLLNGLMIACGPLQAIYIMAAGTGSMVEGAKLLFVFALGTLPVMIGFGYFAGFVSGKLTQKILKLSGAVVILLGLIMLNNGLVLTGSGYDFGSMIGRVSAADSTSGSAQSTTLEDGYQVIRMNVTRYGWEPDKFVLKTGVPVRWIIDGKEITSCNDAIQVPAYSLKFDILEGDQTITFTPDKAGTIRWSCWMGMIPGTFIVKDDIDLDDQSAVQQELDSVPEQPHGTCGCGG